MKHVTGFCCVSIYIDTEFHDRGGIKIDIISQSASSVPAKQISLLERKIEERNIKS